jgi:hypothetical protein
MSHHEGRISIILLKIFSFKQGYFDNFYKKILKGLSNENAINYGGTV